MTSTDCHYRKVSNNCILALGCFNENRTRKIELKHTQFTDEIETRRFKLEKRDRHTTYDT